MKAKPTLHIAAYEKGNKYTIRKPMIDMVEFVEWLRGEGRTFGFRSRDNIYNMELGLNLGWVPYFSHRSNDMYNTILGELVRSIEDLGK